jgi:hypothetical protein
MATNPSVASAPAAAQSNITIDGVVYNINDLSAEAKTALRNVRMAEQQIRRLQSEMSIAQTARAAYGGMLKAELGKKS